MTTITDLAAGDGGNAAIDDLVNDVQLVGGQYVASPATLGDGKRRVLRLTSAGLLMVDASVTIAGGATEAKQDTQITAEQAILAKLSADPATQTTLAALLAKILAAPSTEAKQDTGNTSLASILTSVDGLEGVLGTTAGAAVVTDANGTVQQYLRGLIVNGLLSNTSLASILTSVDGLEGVLGVTSGAAVITDANGTAQQYLRGLIVKMLVLIAQFPAALGSAAAASSFAVTQSTEDVARQGIITETAPASDTASSGQNGRLQRIAQRLTSLIALVPAALGSAAAASSFAVTASTEDIARQGIITETAPASDTASSGQNGRLQRIAQRLTSLIALIPASLGTKLASASLSVTQGAFAYETVAASATNQAMGATGAIGDYLSHVIIMPVTTAAGTVTILDNATTFFTYTTGTLADLRPIIVPIGCNSVSGAWKITTGANVTAVGVGTFT